MSGQTGVRGERWGGPNGDRGALGQTSPSALQTGVDLTHLHGSLQAHHLQELVRDVWKGNTRTWRYQVAINRYLSCVSKGLQRPNMYDRQPLIVSLVKGKENLLQPNERKRRNTDHSGMVRRAIGAKWTLGRPIMILHPSLNSSHS